LQPEALGSNPSAVKRKNLKGEKGIKENDGGSEFNYDIL
jgi:hypothetical protein